MARIGENADCLTVVYIAGKTNVARGAFRAATATSQPVTSVQLNLLWTKCDYVIWGLGFNNCLTTARKVCCIIL